MSGHLEDVLNQYLKWLGENHRPMVDSLQPGLSQAEIDELVSGLPYTLTEEVQTFYRWRNGTSAQDCPFISFYTFLPLDEAISFYHEACEIDEQIKGMAQNDLRIPELDSFKPGWFPMFVLSDLLYAYFVNCADNEGERDRIIETEEGAPPKIIYHSLKQMMDEMLAGCKAGKYTISEDGSFVTQEEAALMPQRSAISNGDLEASLLATAHELFYVDYPASIKKIYNATDVKTDRFKVKISGTGVPSDPFIGWVHAHARMTYPHDDHIIVDQFCGGLNLSYIWIYGEWTPRT